MVIGCTVRHLFSKSALIATLRTLSDPDLGPCALTDDALEWLPSHRNHLKAYITAHIPRTLTEKFPIIVDRKGKAPIATSVQYLPVRRWVQNLLMTPLYARNIRSLDEHRRSNYKVHIPWFGQQSAFCHVFQTDFH